MTPEAGDDTTGLEPPSVDAHAHIWGETTPVASTAWTHPDYAFPVETYVDLLDWHGIAHGVISAASLFGTHSDYVLEALAAYPRLRATVVVEPETDARELARLRDAGVVGVRLQWFLYEALPNLAEDPWRGLLHRLRDLDLHVEININGARIPQLIPAALETGVKVVVDHFGWSDARLDPDGSGFETLLRACQTGRCWVKLSAGYRYDDPVGTPARLARRLVMEAGTDRLFWGSDTPFVGMEDKVRYGDTVRHFAEWLPDAGVRRAISENALRFYFG